MLKIIEDLKYSEIRLLKKPEYKDEIYFPNDPRIVEKSREKVSEIPTEPVKGIIVPEYLKSIKNTYSNCDSAGVFLDLNDSLKCFKTPRQTIENRSNHYCRYEIVQIDEDDFTKLMQKSKQKSVKLTGCFEMIIAIAWFKMTRQFSKELDPKINIKYSVTINLRPYLNTFMDFKTMGCWITTFGSNVEVSSSTEKEFWLKAHQQSTDLHKFIKEKSFFDKKNLQNSDMFYEMIKKGYRVKDLLSYYAVTNIGSYTNTSNRIKIDEYYSGISYTDRDFSHCLFNSLSTIDNKLNWCITYNAKFLSESAVNFLIKEIKSTLKNIIV